MSSEPMAAQRQEPPELMHGVGRVLLPEEAIRQRVVEIGQQIKIGRASCRERV